MTIAGPSSPSGDWASSRRIVDPIGKVGYELAFDESFDGDVVDEARWLPHYLPQWSSREASAARSAARWGSRISNLG
jgi:hypothetical protein